MIGFLKIEAFLHKLVPHEASLSHPAYCYMFIESGMYFSLIALRQARYFEERPGKLKTMI